MNKNGILIGLGMLIFFGMIIFEVGYSDLRRDKTITEMVSKGANPILARCAIDNQYMKDNAVICSDTLKKETK
jgi:hypothetical protein